MTESSHSPSTHTSPSAKYSFFQIGTRRFRRLMASSAASNAALRCGEVATITTLVIAARLRKFDVSLEVGSPGGYDTVFEGFERDGTAATLTLIGGVVEADLVDESGDEDDAGDKGDGCGAGVQPAAQVRRRDDLGGLDFGGDLVHYATVTYATVGCLLRPGPSGPSSLDDTGDALGDRPGPLSGRGGATPRVAGRYAGAGSAHRRRS